MAVLCRTHPHPSGRAEIAADGADPGVVQPGGEPLALAGSGSSPAADRDLVPCISPLRAYLHLYAGGVPVLLFPGRSRIAETLRHQPGHGGIPRKRPEGEPADIPGIPGPFPDRSPGLIPAGMGRQSGQAYRLAAGLFLWLQEPEQPGRIHRAGRFRGALSDQGKALGGRMRHLLVGCRADVPAHPQPVAGSAARRPAAAPSVPAEVPSEALAPGRPAVRVPGPVRPSGRPLRARLRVEHVCQPVLDSGAGVREVRTEPLRPGLQSPWLVQGRIPVYAAHRQRLSGPVPLQRSFHRPRRPGRDGAPALPRREKGRRAADGDRLLFDGIGNDGRHPFPVEIFCFPAVVRPASGRAGARGTQNHPSGCFRPGLQHIDLYVRAVASAP